MPPRPTARHAPTLRLDMRRTIIAAPTELAAEAGAAVADDGGNAIDAAIAASIAAMCTEPGIVAPGASGFLTVSPPDGDTVVIDAYAEMPGRGTPAHRRGAATREVHIDYGGGMRTVIGWGSVATPGAFAGFQLASDRYGAVPWRVLFGPTIAILREGFPISASAAAYLGYAHKAIFGWHPDSARALHRPGGHPIGEGDVLRLPELADTLERIADGGAQEFYRGDLAKEIADAVADGGGILTMEDLGAYEAIPRRPIALDLDGWSVATNPAPAVGGVALGALLLLLRDPAFEGWTERGCRRTAEVQRAVLEHRAALLRLLPTERETVADELLGMARNGDLDAIRRSPSTVHTSTVDSEGLAAAVTVSAGYGSGAVVPGTGLWLNNSLGELELTPEGFQRLEPGARLASNMAPTVARRADGTVLAIGSPGADRITTALASVLLDFIHLGMSLTDAVQHPRLHVERFDGVPTIAYEPGLPVVPFDDLAARRFPDLSMYFGGVQAALWDPIAGLYGAADPRRAGAVRRGGID